VALGGGGPGLWFGDLQEKLGGSGTGENQKKVLLPLIELLQEGKLGGLAQAKGATVGVETICREGHGQGGRERRPKERLDSKECSNVASPYGVGR